MAAKPYPTWNDDAQGAEGEACGRAIWEIARGLAARFCKPGKSIVWGYGSDDLAGGAVVHFFIKLRRGKFRKYSPADMWKVIRKCMWRRMLDVCKRPSNKNVMQAPEVIYDGEPVETDVALEILDAGESGVWGQCFRRSDIKALEGYVDSLLNKLPDQMGLLIKLRFGMWLDDDFGSEFPVMGETVSTQALADAGFGENAVDVHRRVKEALERLRALATAELSK